MKKKHIGTHERFQHDTKIVCIKDFSLHISKNMEQMSAFALEIQEALSNCNFNGLDSRCILKLQNLDLITQSISIYAEIMREISVRIPPEITMQPGPFMLAISRPPKDLDEESENSVVWF